MSEPALFSDRWYRVKALTPRLATDVEVRRHVYRGEVCWVLHRPGTSHWHRLPRAGFELIDQLDGERSVESVWRTALAQRDREAPTQEQFIALMADLHEADLLLVDRPLQAESLFERRERNRRAETGARYLNPFFLRFALADPGRWLTRAAPLARCLFSAPAWLAWRLAMLALVPLLLAQGERLVQDIASLDLLSTRHALAMLLIWPLLKFLHEAAHALAATSRGGAVHEAGIALMVLLPLPYVDASDSAAFVSRRDRLLVDAAGLLAESVVAAVALLIWSQVGGVVGDIALLTFVTAGLSAVLFNANPLMKFDGYYLLSDWLEIPNLQQRSQRRFTAWCRRWLTGQQAVDRVSAGAASADSAYASIDRAAERWLLGYAITSGLYRTGLMLLIAWMLGMRWPVLGVALAFWAVWLAVLRPLRNGVAAVRRDPAYHAIRPLSALVLAPLAVIVLLVAIPLPDARLVPGVVWLPDDAVVRVSVDCEVVRVHRAPGSDVKAGEPLFDCDDPALERALIELRADLDRVSVQRAALALGNPVEDQRLSRTEAALRAALSREQDRAASRQVVAATSGRFDVTPGSALHGRFLAAGDVAGYLLHDARPRVRVAVPESQGARLVGDGVAVSLRSRLPDGAAVTAPSRLLHTPLQASLSVSSAALTHAGGGDLEADPSGDGTRLLAPAFELELELPAALGERPVGSRVHARFENDPSPLAQRWLARLQRALAAGRTA